LQEEEIGDLLERDEQSFVILDFNVFGSEWVSSDLKNSRVSNAKDGFIVPAHALSENYNGRKEPGSCSGRFEDFNARIF
jgi:hypothetical protein